MLENIQLLLYGFTIALTPANLIAAFVGAILGLIVGAMPGIGSLTGVALLLPLTFRIDPTTAVIALASLYYSNMYGGSFSAILLNIPGDTPAIVTAMDGYPMTRKGQAGRALATAIMSSFIGGSIGIVILTISGPLLAKWGLAFGPPELSLLIIFALTSIGWILGENPSAGLCATGLGIMLATVGVDRATGGNRYDFGNVNLLSGIAFIPLVIGLFGFTQVIDMVINAKSYNEKNMTKVGIRDAILTKDDWRAIIPTILRCAPLGCIVGVMPGAGATAATFICYAIEKRTNTFKDLMGTGHPVGIATSESANNAAAAGAFAPLLTLGIPGGGTTAVLMGGLMMWGLRPGPLLFTENPDFVWGLISSMYIGNIMCLLIAFAAIPVMMKVVSVPTGVMVPIVSGVCIIGTYTCNNAMFDVFFMVGAGFVGYFMAISKIPAAPLLLAYVLTPMLEGYVRQTFDISRGRMKIFYSSNISLTLLALIVLLSLFPLVGAVRKWRKNKTLKQIDNALDDGEKLEAE